MQAPGTLNIVATPIGNLEDITYRAVRILGDVDVIAAEDTRVTRKLLDRYDIGTPVIACHEHNEAETAEKIVARLTRGESVALVTDAGTPGISDPGSRVVQRVVSEGLPVVAIPGASAVAALVSVAGSEGPFTFVGFLPRKTTALARDLDELAVEGRPFVLYESPKRIMDLLQVLSDRLPESRCILGRELTKIHEEVLRGTPEQIIAKVAGREGEIRGEIVLMVVPAPVPGGELPEHLDTFLAGLMAFLPRKEAAQMTARAFDVPKKEVYNRSLEIDA
jgi:16S rRNA (cytidine1402-2'-O)-methyltransferase